MIIYLNPLSANSQCYTHSDAEACIEAILSSLDKIEPAIGRTIILHFDDAIDNRELHRDRPLLQTLSTTPKGKNILRKWLLYTKNRANRFDADSTSTTMSYQAYSCTSDISADPKKENAVWLSFAHPALPNSCTVEARTLGHVYSPQYISSLEELLELLPSYDTNPKHSHRRYIRSNGEEVSPMDLPAEAAFVSLICSHESRGSRYSYQSATKKFYKFVKTHPMRSVYHGYEITAAEVPHTVQKKLLAN